MDIKKILLGEEHFSFLLEVLLRTSVMFIAVIVAISLLGKRGVKQLSVFELVIIISMGSAAGDPMFYQEVGILTAFVVFATIIIIYKLVMRLLNRSERFEKAVEGEPVYLVKEGRFCYHAFKHESLAADEFFAELRNYSISQLGQIRAAIMETNGNISVFYYEDDQVLWGLPILPEEFKQSIAIIDHPAHYSCRYCGYTEYMNDLGKHTCTICGREEWVQATRERRIS
ncbi:MAG: DUF421 domain-containing protein [Flavipsychrobacter sp.]|nr:DUF421 domain-containing protein [Flavipsychrobacter sp.]